MEASGEFLYSLHNIDALIGERYQIGIRTLNNLIQFHNQFKVITSWLLNKNHIGMCYDFSSVSLTHVFLTSDSRFTSFSFHRFDRFRSMFYIYALYFYMPITCISTHVFYTCYLHVFFYLLITCHASMAYLYINTSVDLAVSLASL